MRLTDLIVESREKEATGVTSVDQILNDISPLASIDNSLPVIPSTSDWETLSNPTRLSRTFIFDKTTKMKYFISEMMSYQDKIMHHSTMTVSHNTIMVQVYTHDIENVTELDIKLSKFADEIYEDTRFFTSE